MQNEKTVCEELNNNAKQIDEINLNMGNYYSEEKDRDNYPTKPKKFDCNIHICNQNDKNVFDNAKKAFNEAQENLRNAQITYAKIYDFITKYRIDIIANTPNMTAERIQDLIEKLNKEINGEIIKYDSFKRKNITLKKIKETLDFEYKTNNVLLTPYIEALKANSDKIADYSLTKGGKQRTKSRKSSHRKKSRSRSRSKGISKSKRKNKSKK